MNDRPNLLAALRSEVQSAPVAELPAVIGQLAALQAEAALRVASPQQQTSPPAPAEHKDGEDRLLTVAETAARLGQKEQWVRVHQGELHCIRFGRTVRFSEKQLTQAIRRRSYN